MPDYFDDTNVPTTGSRGASSTLRNAFDSISAAFVKVAGYTGSGGKLVRINAAATAQEVVPLGTANQALGMNAAGTAYEHKTIAGTALEITMTHGVGSATASLPTAMTFTGKTVTGGTFSSPTLVTPALGTPASGVATNLTGTASGLTAGNVTTNANLTGHVTSVGNAAVLGSFTSAQLLAALSDETGTGAAVFATSPTLVTPALGTPASGVATNLTGTAASLTAGNVTTNANLTGHITSVGNAAVLGSFTSAQLLAALTDETGTGAAVFASSPTFSGVPITTTPSVGDNTTKIASTAYVLATRLDQLSVPTASVSLNSQKITNVLDPVLTQDAATKGYVDSVAIGGLGVRPAAVCATTANITLSGEQTIDGVLTSLSRVLVKNQTATAENGIYVSAAGAWARASDMDNWLEVPSSFVFIERGTTHGDTGWVCSSDAGGTLGTTAIAFSQFSSSGANTAGTGLTLTGLQFAIDSTVATLTGTQTLTNKTLGGVALGTPVSGVATNLTGTAAGLTSGNVTTNANLTGHVTSVGNAAVLGAFTVAQLNTAVSDADLAILGANTFTGAQKWATALNIASAATVDLNAATTGNRAHITGTVAITAWTLTGGPFTVIFDAATPLTYHATTNRLNSGATSYTTTAGDTADIYSDGTTVFVNITKVAGTPVVTGDSTLAFTPQTKSADYTFVLGDAGDIFVHPAADTVGRTWTIPANASVAYAIGTTIMLAVQKLAGPIRLSITTDTLRDRTGITGGKTLTPNRQYMLVKIDVTEWLLSSGEATLGTTELVLAHITTPFVTAYPWSSAGFGTKFANPATLPTGSAFGVAFSPAGTDVVIGHGTTPFVTAYAWSSSGFGAKFANPATLPGGEGWDSAFSPAGTEVVLAHAVTPFVTAYPWSSAGFGTKFANPATLPTGAGYDAAFSPAGTDVVIGHGTTPFVTAYAWSSSGFGAKFANPATLPTGDAFEVAFSPAGTEVVIAHAITPFVTAYPWSSAGFGTKFANPATLPGGNGAGAAFSPAGTEVVIAHAITPFVTAYPWSSAGFGTKFANPATLPEPTGLGVAFPPAGTEVFIGIESTPFVSAYPWSSAGFGTKLANPASLPPDGSRGLAFKPT